MDFTKELLKKLGETIENYQMYFKYRWYDSNNNEIIFSTGQETLLSIFSKINIAYERIVKVSDFEKVENINKKEIKSLIIFLDEPDMTLHPEWQRKLLKWLFEFIEEKFEKINVQLIVTTNSPLLASDVLKKDIIFLEDGNVNNDINGETFSRNLLEILKDTFFMESLLGNLLLKK